MVMKENIFHLPEVGTPIGGFYPDACIDEFFVHKLGLAKEAECLNGLHPSGFAGSDPCNIHEFDLMKVAELCETVSNYFVVSEEFDRESSLGDIYELLKTLHCAPESLCKGDFGEGYVFLVLWICMYSWQEDKEAAGGYIFDVDSDVVWDPSQYMDNRHSFENLLRPVTWLKNNR